MSSTDASLLNWVLGECDKAGIVRWDEAGVIDTLNEGFLALFGLREQIVAGASITELWRRLRQRCRQDPGELDSAFASIDTLDLLLRPDSLGSAGWIRLSRRPLDKHAPKPIHVLLARELSEHSRDAQAIASSERQLASLFRVAPIGIGTTCERVFQTVNPRFCAMLGYQAEDLIGQDSRLLYFSDAEYRRVGREQKALLQERGLGDIETRLKGKNGKALDVWLSSAWLDPQQPALGVIFTVLDITDRRRHVRALCDSEQRAHALLEAMPDLMFRFSRDGVYLDYKASREDLHAQAPYDLVGLSVQELVPRELADLALHMISETLETGVLQQFEYELDVSHRGLRNWEARMVPSGQDEVIATVRDITERKRSQLRLIESEERYRTLYEQIPQGVILHGADGRILDANPAAERILGLTRGQMLGDTSEAAHWRCIHEDGSDFPASQHPVMEALRSGLPVKNTMMGVFNAQQDDFVWIVVDAAPIFRRKDGAAECVFVSFSDITELLQMQRALIQSQKMEAIGRLTGGIAHDFNNILGSVLGFAELAKMRNAGRDGKLDVYLRQINIAGGRARDLVRQLLIFSRGEHTDEAKPTPMKPMLVEALRLLRPVLPMNLRIRTELSEDTPPVKIDPLHVQQLLMNLSLNARDAMRDGGVLGISLGVVRIDQEQCALSHQAIDGEWVELSVSDTGCGIPTEGRDRLFQPFYTTKGIGEGSGMGLAMVAGLVRTYQGHVLLQSEPGQGSRFRLLLPPAADVEVEADPIPAAASHARPIPDARVLVVDDDDAIRLFLSELLHNNGAEASACESAESAFELFEQSPSGFDLIISDLSMPGMDGVEFIRHVRRLDQAIKIVLCTGYADAIDEQIQEQLDIATVLLKPVDPEALLETLRSILAMSSPS